MSGFENFVSLLLDGARARMLADLDGIPFCPLPQPKTLRYAFKVKVDHTYDHSDQDVNRGSYNLKKGEFVTLSEKESPYFMPDRSRLEFLGMVWE